MNYLKLRITFVACLLVTCVLSSSAQMTRGQILRKFYQITTLVNSGKEAEAVAICEELIAAYPAFPDTYRRLAEIYDSAGEGEMAMAMYRQYVSLEMDDDKVAECSPRLKELEDKFGVSHIENQEREILGRSEKITIPSQNTAVGSESQPSDNVDFESLFDISALVATASDDSEYLSELSEPEMPVSTEQLSEASAKLMIDGYQAEMPIPDETIREIETLFTTAKTSDAIVNDVCSEPFRFVPENGALAKIGIVPSNSKPEVLDGFKSPGSLCGRWASSSFNDDNGREFLLFEIRMVGDDLFLSFDEGCGLFREHRNNILKTSWNRIKSIWTTDGAKYDARALSASMNKVKYAPDHLTVSCPLPVRNRPNVANMGKNLLDNLSVALPYGTMVSRLGGTLINYVSRNHSNSSFQTVIELDIKCFTDDVLVCDFIVHESQNNSGTPKEVLVENRSFYMYRMSDDYSSFCMEDSERDTPMIRAMYRKLESESDNNPQLLFPLALMSYCKAGLGENVGDVSAMSKAVSQMQKLSDDGCLRASAWLVPVYYNLSMDEEHYPLRLQRKHFRAEEEKLLDEMIAAGIPAAYGLKGDILAGGYTDTDKAMSYYAEGMKKGDAHSYYRMGVICDEGQLVARDYSKSMEYLRKAMDMGYADAYLQTALAYRHGHGVEKDYTQYIKYLNKAVESGSNDAVLELSEALMIGIGVERDVNKAIECRSLYLKRKTDIWRGVLDMYGYSLNE